MNLRRLQERVRSGPKFGESLPENVPVSEFLTQGLMPFFALSVVFHVVLFGGWLGFGPFSSKADAPPARDNSVRTILIVGAPIPMALQTAPKHVPPAPVTMAKAENHPAEQPKSQKTPAKPQRRTYTQVFQAGTPESERRSIASQPNVTIPSVRGDSGTAGYSKSAAYNDYVAKLQAKIQRQQSQAKGSGEARALFELTLDSRGAIRQIRLVSAAGDPGQVDEAVRLIRMAAPFGPPPAPFRDGMLVRLPMTLQVNGE